MRIFDAVWAFRYHAVLPQNLEGAIFGHSLDTYGWIWLVVTAIYLMSAGALVFGSQIGRWVGVVAAAIGVIGAIWWMPYYPVSALTYVALGGLVIYALVAYGGQTGFESIPESRGIAHLARQNRANVSMHFAVLPSVVRRASVMANRVCQS